MESIDLAYKDLAGQVLEYGQMRDTRNGKTISLFGTTLSFNMAHIGLPLLSLRKIYFNGVVGEFRGFLRDATTVQEFKDLGCNYWDLWADKDGNLTLDYPPREQLSAVVESIIKDPNGRRHMINLWNHKHLPSLSLPCCHFNYQFYVRDEYLDMVWTQRSVDVAVGLPSDFILAALYLIYIGEQTNLKPGRVVMNFGDTHIYEEHIKDMEMMLQRTPSYSYIDYQWENEELVPLNYKFHDPIKFELKG